MTLRLLAKTQHFFPEARILNIVERPSHLPNIMHENEITVMNEHLFLTFKKSQYPKNIVLGHEH